MSKNDPMLIVYVVRGKKHQERHVGLQKARARAIQVIGIDDRIRVSVYHYSTQKIVGIVGSMAGMPYWSQSKKGTRTLNADGSLQEDYFF